MNGFNNLFWGFLIIIVDFRINSFDITPDFLGYWIIYKGLKDLAAWNNHFEKAKRFSIILGIIAITDIIQINMPLNELRMDPLIIGVMLMGGIIAIIDLFLVYHICQGINELADNNGFLELARKSLNRWQLYLYAKITTMVMTPVILSSPSLAIIGMPVFILVFIIAVMLAFLMKEAQNNFGSMGM